MRKFCVYRIFVNLFVLYDSCNSFVCVRCVACLALLLFLLSLLLIVLVRFSSFYLGSKFMRFYIYFLYVALHFCSSVSVI